MFWLQVTFSDAPNKAGSCHAVSLKKDLVVWHLKIKKYTDSNCCHQLGSHVTCYSTTVLSTFRYDNCIIIIKCEWDMTHFVQMYITWQMTQVRTYLWFAETALP